MRRLPDGTVTLLLTDIEGSTRLLQRVGAHYATLLEESRRLLRTAFGQWHGQEVTLEEALTARESPTRPLEK